MVLDLQAPGKLTMPAPDRFLPFNPQPSQERIMIKQTTLLFALLALAATSFAGQEIEYGKDKSIVPPGGCFNAHELQLDVFGDYAVGLGPDHAGRMNNHEFGGGVGVSYFLTRYIGIGIDNELQSGENRNLADYHHLPHTVGDHTSEHANGSLIFRYPIDRYCIAPYLNLGGGGEVDKGNSYASFFLGAGLEYRILPNKIGLFMDERWTYLGAFGKHDDQNNFTTRAGVRWLF
jgi:hypothetical protein